MHCPRLRSRALLIGTIVFRFLLVAQNLETTRPGDAAKVIEPELPSIEKAPVIDGALDNSLQSLPVRHFAIAYKAMPDTLLPITYRLGYGTGFFYLYVEVQAEKAPLQRPGISKWRWIRNASREATGQRRSNR